MMRGMGCPFEALFVDDGSVDGSSEEIDRLAREAPEVRAVHFEANCGQSAAFDAGFRRARGAIVVTLDADLQNDPADIPRLVARLEESRAGAVVGVRIGRRDTLVRRVSSRIGNFVRNVLTRDRVTDTGCSLKVYRRSSTGQDVSRHASVPADADPIEGFEVLEFLSPIARRHGESKYGIANRALSGLADVLAVRWMGRRASLQDSKGRSAMSSLGILHGHFRLDARGHRLSALLFTARFIVQ